MKKENLPQSMAELMLMAAQKYPTSTAIECLGYSLSYEQLKDNSLRFAAALISMGVTSEDTVTICLPNIPSAAIAFYGTNIMGANINLVLPLLPANQIEQQMKQTDSRYIVILDTLYEKCGEVIRKNNFTAIAASPTDFLCPVKAAVYKLKSRKLLKKARAARAFKSLLQESPVYENAPSRSSLILVHSGGTSGLPKTIELSNESFNNLIGRGAHMLSKDPADMHKTRMLMVLPMFHGFGLCMCLHAMMANGAVTVMIPRFDKQKTLKEMIKQKTDVLIGVPAMYDKMLGAISKKADLSFVRNIFCGGDTLTPAMADKLNAILKDHGCKTEILEGFGLTEAVTVNAVNTLDCHRAGSVGKSLPGMKHLIADENLRILPVGAEGEILLHSDTHMNGYYRDEAATAACFTEIDGLKYLRTGDCGHMDEDGFLYFRQRMSRIYKISGMKVFPAEIEGVITALDLTLSAAVKMTDAGLTAFLALKTGVTEEDARAKISAHLKDNLSYWSQIKRYVFMPALPSTPLGKIDYNALQ